MKIEYEDSFVKIASLLGGEDYVKVARALLNNENATDEEIASATGLKINSVRKALYDLFGRSLISGIRVRDLKEAGSFTDGRHSEIRWTVSSRLKRRRHWSD